MWRIDGGFNYFVRAGHNVPRLKSVNKAFSYAARMRILGQICLRRALSEVDAKILGQWYKDLVTWCTLWVLKNVAMGR